MDSVAKGFGCNVSLGGGCWSALYGLSFSDKKKKYPLIRCALALANLTGDKVDEGFAKTVGKTDVGKITAKAKAAEAEEVEGILADAMEIATAIGGMQKVVKPLGQLFVRIGLKASQREKNGRERKAYEYDDIRSMYLGDVGKILGEPVAFDKWPTTKKTADATAEKPDASSASARQMASLSDLSDPVWLAGQAGFKIGKTCVEKGVDPSLASLHRLQYHRQLGHPSPGDQLPWCAWGCYDLFERAAEQLECDQNRTAFSDERATPATTKYCNRCAKA